MCRAVILSLSHAVLVAAHLTAHAVLSLARCLGRSPALSQAGRHGRRPSARRSARPSPRQNKQQLPTPSRPLHVTRRNLSASSRSFRCCERGATTCWLTAQELAAAVLPRYSACIKAFGATRCMFESNFPPDKEAVTYRTLYNAFKRCGATPQASPCESGVVVVVVVVVGGVGVGVGGGVPLCSTVSISTIARFSRSAGSRRRSICPTARSVRSSTTRPCGSTRLVVACSCNPCGQSLLQLKLTRPCTRVYKLRELDHPGL